MVWVPGGPFIMGTHEVDTEGKALELGIVKPWFSDEHPSHKVTLDPYYIDRYEVTQGEYGQFVSKTNKRPPADWSGRRSPPDRERHPVVFVSWRNASDYCKWKGKRLPNEAEWEKAARGNDERIYPWGNTFDQNRSNIGGFIGKTLPVGSYENGKSPYGAYDMIGNVWEWTSDWYQAYPGNTENSEDFGEKFKVLRGSSWAGVGHFPGEEAGKILAHNSRVTFRLFSNPEESELNDVGFRCAKSA
jgi:formylglycine-generating enzyme required for sulfatase activity